MALNSRLKYLREYLLNNTDENNTVTNNDIRNHFLEKYGMKLDRKTVCSDIELLIDYGMVIEYEKQKKEYHYQVYKREFELIELQLLIDSVQSSRYLTQEKVDELTNKLKKLASDFGKDTLERQCLVKNRIRNTNNSAFYDTDTIHKCIANEEKNKLSFLYFKYNEKKEKVYNKKKKPYVVSPYALIWDDNKYYLLAYTGYKMKHFRVDRMEKVEELKGERKNGEDEFKKFNLEERTTRVFSMFGGKEQRVCLRFHNDLACVVLDHFGKDVEMTKVDDNHFIVNVNVEVSKQFFGWLCGLGRAVKIIEPDEVVVKMGKYVSSISQMYKHALRRIQDVENNKQLLNVNER